MASCTTLKQASLMLALGLLLGPLACGGLEPEELGSKSSASVHNDTDIMTLRVDSRGRLDPGWGDSGVTLSDLRPGNYDEAYAAVLDPGGRLVVAGTTKAGMAGDTVFAVARYTSRGRLDSSFGSGGKVFTNFSSTTKEQPAAVAVDSRGRIVVAGHGVRTTSSSTNPNGRQILVARYNSDGSPDGSFGSSGKVRTNFVSADSERAVAVLVDASDRIVVVGHASITTGGHQLLLVRYRVNGTRDSSFDHDGKVLTGFSSAPYAWARAAAMDAAGKIVVVGDGEYHGQQVLTLARYRTNGALDSSFNRVAGLVATPGLGGATPRDVRGKQISRLFSSRHTTASALLIDSAGRYVVAGQVFSGHYATGSSRLMLVRYHADGRLDYSFNGKGVSITNFISTAYERVTAAGLDPSGRIVLAGLNVRDTPSQRNVLLARVNANGQRDRTFGSDGKVRLNLTTNSEEAAALALDSSGRPLVVGTSRIHRTCQPELTESCRCSNGRSGQRTCDSAGSAWGSCRCQACTPGATSSCTCSDGRSGRKTCNAAGSGYGSCACTGPRHATRTIRLYNRASYTWTGPIPYTATFGAGISGRLERITLDSSLGNIPYRITQVYFPKQGYTTADCNNPSATVDLSPGDSTTAAQLRAIYGSSAPALPVTIAACYGGLNPTPLPNFPIKVGYTY